MPSKALGSLILLAVCLVHLAVFLGCEKKNPEIPKPSLDRMQTIYATYVKVTDSLKRPPKDLDEFKRGLPSNVDAKDLLTSPHDGKPYVLVFNINPQAPPQSALPPLLAYEQEGSGGMFDVVTTMGVVRCTAEDLQKMKAATPGAK
jgi:hypothetical protein